MERYDKMLESNWIDKKEVLLKNRKCFTKYCVLKYCLLLLLGDFTTA